jgi:purine nucleosidase
MRERIIIDTDIGDDIDDALAVAMAVNSPELDIIGITTVFRNVKARARLAVTLLKYLNRDDIPVVPGIGAPLVNKPVDTLFSSVNVDELPGQYSSEMDEIELSCKGDAIEFMEEVLKTSQDPITIMPIGPLTNIAALITKNPDIKYKIKRLVVMGGAYYINQSEYNILCDPEAAKIVFDSGIPIIGVGLDVTGKCKLTAQDVERIKNSEKPSAKLLYKLISRFMSYSHHLPYLHDALTVAVAFQPDLVKMENKRIAVETAGEFTRGMTFNISNSRWWERDRDNSTIQVCSQVDRNRFVSLFLDRII